jgi:hypothetical protein
MAAAACLAIANTAKYASALWDPVVILMAASAAWPSHGRKPAIRHAAIISSYLVILLTLLIVVATISNRDYIIGIQATTLARQPGPTSALTVLHESWSWTQILALTAMAGLAAVWWHESESSRRVLALTLAGAGLLAPLNQARLHTEVSLIKHTDYGAWFVAILGGYLISRVMRGNLVRRALAGLAVLASIGGTAVVGYPQAVAVYSGWPDSTRVLAIIRPLAANSHGPMLLQNPAVFEYYLKTGGNWRLVTGQSSIRLPSGRTIDISPVGRPGIPGPYLRFIKAGYFKIIVLNDNRHDPYDGPLISAISRNPRYVEVGRTSRQAGNFIVWKYRPGRRH